MKGPIYTESPESERRFQRMVQLGRELRTPVNENFIEIKVTMPGREEPIHWHKQRSHSWVRNAYNILICDLMALAGSGAFGDGTGTPLKNTAGGVISGTSLPCLCKGTSWSNGEDPENPGSAYLGGIGDPSFGIQFGIGTGAESFDSYALGGLCTEGITANKLNYIAMAAPSKTWVAETRTLTVVYSRFANNNSPGTISIAELGLVAKCAGPGNAATLTLMARDLLAIPIDVPASGQLLATYTLSVVFP